MILCKDFSKPLTSHRCYGMHIEKISRLRGLTMGLTQINNQHQPGSISIAYVIHELQQ